MRRLSLAVLGSPEIRLEGQALTFRTRKALALFIYLVVEGGPERQRHSHSREKLTLFFWPESDSTRGRMMLRTTLAHLRQALTQAADYVLVEGDSLSFNFNSDYQLDLDVLEAAGRAVRDNAAVDDLRPALEAAVAAYRDDLLAGFTLNDAPDFDEWATTQREAWHRRMAVVFDHLSQLQSDQGDLVRALETASRWVRHDALNETAHRRLMQLHFAVGDRTAALRVYEAFRTRLAKELNAEPEPETVALANRLSGRTPFDAPAAQRRLAALPATTTPPPLAASLPMVGRAMELATLITASYAVRRGQTQVVILEGEAGIGKTRLASEFVNWAVADGMQAWQGRAFETGGHLPYQAILESLRQRLDRENAPEDLLDDVWLAELSRLLPELRERYPDLPPPLTVGEGEAQTRLFESITRLGQALAARVPGLFFIDDIHWADSASLDLLHYAARRWAETHSPVLVLLTLRSEAGQAFAQWLADLNRALPSQHLVLDSLTADHTLQLIQTLAGREVTTPALQAFSEWLFTETDGQPFFMMEMLKALVERGVLAPLPDQASEWTVDFNSLRDPRTFSGLVPTGVRDVIRARLIRLSPAAADLLAAASVVGQTANFEALCQVAGVGEGEGLRALDELLAGRLLLESAMASTAPKYLFAHDKIREAVYTEAGEARRRVFHRRALAALEAEAAPPATLARHALAGGLDERGFHLSLAAGDEALRVFAVRDAIAHYLRAEKLLAVRAQLGDWESRFHLQRQLGRAYELMADFPNARSVYESMLALARSVPAPKAECVALNRLATLTAHELHKPTALPTAITLLEQARQIAVASGDTVGLAETEWNLAQSFFYSWEVRHSIAHGEQALQLARELSASASAQPEAATRELVGRCLNVLAYPKLIAGRFAETETHAIEAYAIYAELGNRAMETDCLCLASEAQVRTGRLETGIATARTSRAISFEIDNLWGQANTAYHLGFALLEHGDYGEALAVSQTGVASAKAAGYSPQRIFNLLTFGNILRALFSLPAACSAHLEALAINATLPPRPVSEPIYSELCADYALTENWVEAHAYARQALAARDYEVLINATNRWYETEALIRGGDTELAEEDLRRYAEHIGDNLRRRTDYLRALAVLEQTRGETEQAAVHLREAATIAEQIGLPGELWPIYAALGETGRAAEIVKAIAAKIDDPQVRETFLSAKPVRRLSDIRE